MIDNLKILKDNPHLLDFIKQSKAVIEFTNLPAFNYTFRTNKVVESQYDYYIIKDNKLIADDEMIFTSVGTYLKEDAYKLSKTSKKIILYVDISNPMEKDRYRFVPIEEIEESYNRCLRRERIKKLQKQGRKKRIYDSRKNKY